MRRPIPTLSPIRMNKRRFAVKGFVLTGCVFAVGCKHLDSAVKLFERKAQSINPTWSVLVLMDREKWRVVRSVSLGPEPEPAA